MPYTRKPCEKKKFPICLILKFLIILLVFAALLVLLIELLTNQVQPRDESISDVKLVKEYEYRLLKHSDVSARDLIHVQAPDIASVQKVCDIFDECVAFNSNGWLKTSASFQQSSQSHLYIKLKATGKIAKPAPAEPSKYSEMMGNLKIYVYQTNIGSEHRPHRTGGYAVERKFVEILLRSPFITQSGDQATFFFIPIRCSSYILDATNEHQGLIQARHFVGEILEEIKKNHPYWSRSSGSDHFYICAHDIGAAVGDGVLKNAVALVNTADYDDPFFVPHKDISLPPTASFGLSGLANRRGGAVFGSNSRAIFAFFAGDLTTGRIRPSLWNKWSQDVDMVLINHELAHNSYTDYLKRSKFCLIIRGRESWSPRLAEAIFSGCVPVIISDHYHLPLQGVVNWDQFSVIIPESEVSYLKNILRSISSAQLQVMQDKLKEIYQHFVWNKPARSYDAFYSVMMQLWQRRHVIRCISSIPLALGWVYNCIRLHDREKCASPKTRNTSKLQPLTTSLLISTIAGGIFDQLCA